jgi:hypothetical protein
VPLGTHLAFASVLALVAVAVLAAPLLILHPFYFWALAGRLESVDTYNPDSYRFCSPVAA